MENSSKALLIIAEVMVGVLLLSLVAALFFLFDNYQQKTQENINSKELYEFNARFLAYEDKELTPQDVLTIFNMVKEYNLKFDGEEVISIKGIAKSIVKNNSEFLNTTTRYEIPENGLKYGRDGRIYEITIRQKTN